MGLREIRGLLRRDQLIDWGALWDVEGDQESRRVIVRAWNGSLVLNVQSEAARALAAALLKAADKAEGKR